jgi:hypothetical protein
MRRMGDGGTIPPFLTTALNRREVSFATLLLWLRERAPGTHWMG